jgi:hypothetical protein
VYDPIEEARPLKVLAPLGLVSSLVAILATSSRAVGDDTSLARFERGPDTVDVFDAFEVVVRVHAPAPNPFRDVEVTGHATRQTPGGSPPQTVEGFCDSADGSTYRIRFMPEEPGAYAYTVTCRQGDRAAEITGTFTARDAGHRGPIRVDPEHPWHFVYQGTHDHFFWNGTTTYWLLGWNDEAVIRAAIDRLARLKVNRIRVALCGRTTGGSRWDEPQVVNTEKFRFRLEPWPAARPESVENPGYDVTRYNVGFWQKAERAVAYARDRGIVVSIVFFLDGRDPGVDPFGKTGAGGDDETRYYRYAVARLASFPNLMWDVTNEYHLFRTEPWVEQRGALLKQIDPHRHLTSVHGNARYPFRTSAWSDFAMYQAWDEKGGHDFLLDMRREQAATGRAMPQINEEYGYENHYPARWGGGRKAPARSADNRRRLAWGMSMAGGYQTTGERADRGAGRPPDSGGGWLTGRGDDAMTMLAGYAHIVDAFARLKWWLMDPHDELVTAGAYCLAEPGRQYLVYIPSGSTTTLKLPDGASLVARWFDPRSGVLTDIGPVTGPTWTTPAPPPTTPVPGEPPPDWAVLLTRD